MNKKTYNFKVWLKIIFFIYIFLGFAFLSLFVQKANAQVGSYTRTPSSSEIYEGTTINFSGDVTTSSNSYSYKLRVRDIDLDSIQNSSCVTVSPVSDEIFFDIDMVLPVDEYMQVQIVTYAETSDTDCEGDETVYSLESGAPAFSVVAVLPGTESPSLLSECTTSGSVETCEYTGSVFFAFFVFVSLTVSSFVILLVIFMGRKLL